MTAQEKREARRARRNERVASFRFLKNLFIWFMGFTAFFVILVSALFVGAKIIPVSTYVNTFTNEDTDKYVSSEIASKSLVDIINGFDNYTFDDLPVINEFLEGLLETSIGDKDSGKKIERLRRDRYDRF